MVTDLRDDSVKQTHVIQSLVEMARSGLQLELRQGRRFPFFQPVTLTSDLDGSVSLSAFTRDISAWGIGLLTYWPLRLRPVNLTIHFSDEERTILTGYVRWCHSCGQGWFVAGVSFHRGDCDDVGYEVGGFTA
jgi:hypothetical protein